LKAAIYFLLFFSLTAGYANATITLTRVGDVSIYQNNQGRYYISDGCHSTGNSMDPNATIGPGYIYRVDLNGKEVVAPLPSGKTIPLTGLGVFVADMYEGDPNNTANGYFESVQGNVCQGDNNNLVFTEGSGVSASFVDDIGTASSAADGSYLWVHYRVVLSDQAGVQFEVWYWYRFYATSVQMWTKLRPCPSGVCNHDSRGPSSFVKMSKFEFAVSSAAVDYTAETCYTASGAVIQTAGNITNPNGSTINNHCNGDTRDYIRMYASSSGMPGFKFIGEAQPSANFGPTFPTFPWECNSGTCSDYGVDHLATIGAGRGAHLPYDGMGTSCGTSLVPSSSQDLMRRWEMGGDDGTHGFYPAGSKTLYAMFKGWEDGNGPTSCPTLYNQMFPNESYANFFNISQL